MDGAIVRPAGALDGVGNITSLLLGRRDAGHRLAVRASMLTVSPMAKMSVT
jgi:hypothetical protein